MRIYKLLKETKAEGPGVRACIWVQGCSHGCGGCFAKHLWNPAKGEEITIDEVIAELESVLSKIEGITFLGGEPFEQADELWQIAKYIRDAGKSVITFTGYVYEELIKKDDDGVKKLLEYTDVLADGPFVEELISYDRPMLGSSNQRYIYLSEKIPASELENYKNSFEVRISQEGKVQVNGMGDLKQLERYLNKIDGGYDEATNI